MFSVRAPMCLLVGALTLACLPNPDPPGWMGGGSGRNTGGASGGSGGSGSGGSGSGGSGAGTGGSSAGSGNTGGSGSGGTGGSGAGGSGSSTGGAGGSGSAGRGGTGGSGGSAGGTGGSSAGGSGGTGGTGGSSTGGSGGARDGGMEASTSAASWPGCLEPVFSGVMPAEFCMVYEKVCTFSGMNRYTSLSDCMSKFRGGANDGDACKSGHLCRASMAAATREMDCRTSGTAACRN